MESVSREQWETAARAHLETMRDFIGTLADKELARFDGYIGKLCAKTNQLLTVEICELPTAAERK